MGRQRNLTMYQDFLEFTLLLSRVPKNTGKGQLSFPLFLRFGHESRMCVDPKKGFKTFFQRDILEIIHILCML